jgi:hypothetical protein
MRSIKNNKNGRIKRTKKIKTSDDLAKHFVCCGAKMGALDAVMNRFPDELRYFYIIFLPSIFARPFASLHVLR